MVMGLHTIESTAPRSSDARADDRFPGDRTSRMLRLIEGLQALAAQLPADAPISEFDRVHLAGLLNEGKSPCEAAGAVFLMRGI